MWIAFLPLVIPSHYWQNPFFVFSKRWYLRLVLWSSWWVTQFSWVSPMYVCSVAKLCPTLCNPVNCNLPGSSVHVISQMRTLEWISISSSRGSPWLRDWTCGSCCIFCLADRFLTIEPPGKPDVYMLLDFDFLLYIPYHVNLILRPATRTWKGREKFLPSWHDTNNSQHWMKI